MRAEGRRQAAEADRTGHRGPPGLGTVPGYTITGGIANASFTLKVPVLGNITSRCPTYGHGKDLDFCWE